MHDEAELQVTQINEVVLQVPDATNFSIGDLVRQHQVLTATVDLHQSLLDFWRPTCCAMASIDESTWQRVTGFFQAYVPRFHLGPATLVQWRKALKRYKPVAARGVDGLSHLDLLAMPDSWTLRLLDLLHDIDEGRSSWPTAVRYGLVSVIAKDFHAATVDRYRPIVIFSVLCTTWASLRSKQLLRALAARMDVESYGFLPGCEPSQLWLVLQAEIEGALQHDAGLCGLSTDLQRAFNFVPRQHTTVLASHLGVPARIVRPWNLFLSTCTRAFDVRGSLSESTLSTCGLPEGDALSVYGMIQLCFTWHIYMRIYIPEIRSMSFVDNLSLLTRSPGFLARGLACLIEFFRLWNMRIDEGKSYCQTAHCHALSKS
eukprot:s675_g30.t1